MKFNGKILELNYMQEGTAHYTRIFKLRFNEKVQKIQIIGFDSEYRYNVRSTVKKSFNLLTGYFINEKLTTDFNEKLTTEKVVGINKNFKNLFLENLDCGTVFKLDEVGTDRF